MGEDTSVIAAILYRLAHDCQEHLQDATLASRLRTMAAGETFSFSDRQPPSLAEATALAGAVNRYLSAGNGVALGPDTPSNLPALRDLAQEVESALAAPIRREAASRVAGLYVIVDPELTRGRDVVEVARAALRGGATAIQLRDKVRNKGVQLPVARRLFEVCQEFGASFIINDHADLAVACGAHGLHVGHAYGVYAKRKQSHCPKSSFSFSLAPCLSS